MKTFHLRNGKKVKVLKERDFVCLDETHLHQSSILKVAELEIDRHYVEVVQDGNAYSVRIDKKIERINITVDQAVAFVRENT